MSTASATSIGLHSALEARGLLHQVTDPALDEKLTALVRAGRVCAYAGFDPTAESLHIGNFLAITALMHAQRQGIAPIAVVGGATGLVGDPSGKDSERQLQTRETVAEHAEGIGRVLERFLDFDDPAAPARIVSNLDWFGPMSAIDFLRDVGKHFRVGTMLGKDFVRSRLADGAEGLSYTEFSYQLLQGYDFYKLYKQHRCVLQVGGSDQWGNITAGIELIRKLEGEAGQAFGMSYPLITTAGGKKFGKSEGNAIWLTAEHTSVYDFYQFWLRAEDADAGKYLRMFTFLPLEEIDDLERQGGTRVCQQRLADEVTRVVHGDAALGQAKAAAEIMYGGVIEKGIDEATLAAVFDQVPSIDVPRDRLASGWSAVEAAVEAGLVRSKSEARRLISQGGFYVNNRQVRDVDATIGAADLVTPGSIVLRAGKKNYRVVRVV